jgi:hypothetical protein
MAATERASISGDDMTALGSPSTDDNASLARATDRGALHVLGGSGPG